MEGAEPDTDTPGVARGADERVLDTTERARAHRLERLLRESEMRRADAEQQARQLMQAFSHVTRMVALTDLWASLAHELSQPVTAILSNAHAGLQVLSAGGARAAQLRPILNDIESDAGRAGEIFRRVRGLLNAGRQECEEIDLNEIVSD